MTLDHSCGQDFSGCELCRDQTIRKQVRNGRAQPMKCRRTPKPLSHGY